MHTLTSALDWRNAATGVAAVGIRRIYVTRLFGFPNGVRCDNCTLLRLAFSLLIIPEGRKLLRSDASRSLSYILLKPIPLPRIPVVAQGKAAVRFPEWHRIT